MLSEMRWIWASGSNPNQTRILLEGELSDLAKDWNEDVEGQLLGLSRKFWLRVVRQHKPFVKAQSEAVKAVRGISDGMYGMG